MKTASFTANQISSLSAPSLASAVAKSVDNLGIFITMNLSQTISKFHERRWLTASAVVEGILARLSWYHFLTPNRAADPDPVRGRVVYGPAKNRSVPPAKVNSGTWDVLIP